jgi:hypothetical protein
MLETDQQIDMNDCPEHPGKPTANLPPAEIEDGSMAPDDRCVATIVKLKWLRNAPLPNLLRKCTPKVPSLLFCDLGKTRQRRAPFVSHQRQIAERKYVLKTMNG